MVFRCKSCGAVTVWSPEHDRMCCPHCDSIDSDELITNENEFVCATCGAPMQPKNLESATKCEHCGAYTIFESRISGPYTPHLIIPFKIGKQKAKDLIRQEFGKKLFLPTNFLKEAYLDKIEGDYIPFFMYDFACNYRYTGKGKKIRTWTRGNTEYTETSIFQIYRTMNADFFKVPVDASVAMPDDEMDLLEPFDYSKMFQFHPRFMSGYHGEMYSLNGMQLEPRAKGKIHQDARALMKASITGYSSVTPELDDCRLDTKSCSYALLPIWEYTYKYRGKDYRFHLNGETGKLIGAPPLSVGKCILYSGTVFTMIMLFGCMMNYMLGVM